MLGIEWYTLGIAWVVVATIAGHYVFLFFDWRMGSIRSYVVGSVVWSAPVSVFLVWSGNTAWAMYGATMLAVTGVTTVVLRMIDKKYPRRHSRKTLTLGEYYAKARSTKRENSGD